MSHCAACSQLCKTIRIMWKLIQRPTNKSACMLIKTEYMGEQVTEPKINYKTQCSIVAINNICNESLEDV